MNKMREYIAEASIVPKERNQYEGIGEKGKAVRRAEKKRRGDTKASRRVDKDSY